MRLELVAMEKRSRSHAEQLVRVDCQQFAQAGQVGSWRQRRAFHPVLNGLSRGTPRET